jgi:hypothetical protein
MSYSTGSRKVPSLDTIAEVLAATAEIRPDGRGRLHAPPGLQSWPGIVHGGGLVALLDAIAVRFARISGPRRIDARLTSSVPVDTTLTLEGQTDADAVSLTILDNGQTLGGGTIRAIAGDGRAERAPWAGGAEGWPLPLSEQCLACGAMNPLGLQAQLRFDRAGVWARLRPREPWRTAEGSVHPALGPVLLDEVAWWLGALVMKEGGLTNRIDVALHRSDAAFSEDVIAAGRFDDVKPVDRRRLFWRTETALLTSHGALLATASIVFRGGGEYSARQMEYFRARTAADIFRRMFPNYAI